MLRNAVWVVVLGSIFLSINVATAANRDELAKKFSEAQRLTSVDDIPQAIRIYQSIIRANPQLPEAYNNLAALYLKQKNTKQAKQILEKGLLAHKGYGALYESLTAINVAMARDAYSKALQIDLKPADISIPSLALMNKPPVLKKRTIVIADKGIQKVKAAPSSEKLKKQVIVTNPTPPATKKLENAAPIEKTLQAWSAAWSAQAVDMYLSFYHEQYKPSNGLSHKGWIQSRRLRLKKPKWIKISLSDFDVKQQTNKQAVVNFKQRYQSNSFHDVSTKQMILLYTKDGWRIFREKSL